MAQQQVLSPQRIAEMEVLMMPIVELSAHLNSLAENCSLLSFGPRPEEFQEFDALVGVSSLGYKLEITAPSTGNPSVNLTDSNDAQEHSHAAWVIEAITKRRVLLYRLTECLIGLFPNTPERGVYETTSMGTVADISDIPITTVSRLIDRKKLLTDAGLFSYASFFKKTARERR